MKVSLKIAFLHFKTISHHRHMVIMHCKKAGILKRGLLHDLSKYMPSEFLTGAKYYTDGKKSPNETERYYLGYSKAWLHHKGRNKHHFEYWNDYNPKEGKVTPIEMPVVFLKELICDRIAASKIYQGENYNQHHPIDYYMKGDINRFIHQNTSNKIVKLLTLLSEEGEDALFCELRNMK